MNLEDRIAFGVGMNRVNNQVTVTPGMGFRISKVSLGVNAPFLVGGPGINSFGVGLRWWQTKNASLGIVCYDVPFAKSWTVGFGFGRQETVMAEIDFLVTLGNNYSLSAATGLLSVTFIPKRSVWLTGRWYLPVAPQIWINGSNIEVGLHIWLFDRMAIYGMYHTKVLGGAVSQALAGVKLKL
jgi:hypothetical protein